MLKKIEGAVDSGSELQINLQKYLLTIGSLIKRGDLTGGVEMNAGLDNSQDNNFYYEREWRTIFDWKFDDSVIAAIMIPQEYRVAFHEKWKDRFVNSSIISSQMIETL